MAVGASRMFGIRLPLNFNSPYQATGIGDFWRRWHLTLSRFLRDYLYITLGGNRRGETRRLVNLMATMVLGGLWHGAGWGFLHGLFLIVNHMWRKIFGRPSDSPVLRTFSRLFTIFVVMLAWVPFRAQSIDGALAIYTGMMNLPLDWQGGLGVLGFLGFTFTGPAFGLGNIEALAWLVFWLLVVWQVPNTQQLMAQYAPAYNYDQETMMRDPLPWLMRGPRAMFWRPGWRWGIVIGLMFAISMLNLNRVSEFLYYQF